MFTALLDTCVLWPSKQRNFLLSLAIVGMYRPAWSWRILEELEYAEEAKLLRRGFDSLLAHQRAKHLVSEMRTAFDDAELEGWESLEGSYGLPDSDDEHVVAAAFVGGAGVIVTDNLRDFPTDKLPTSIEVQSPQAFALNTVALAPRRARTAVEAMSARTGIRGPVETVDDILDVLVSRYKMTTAVDLIRATLD